MPNFRVCTKALLTRSPLPRALRENKKTKEQKNLRTKSSWVHKFMGFLVLVQNTRPFDLHALSTPPAFILDQDQILNKSFQLLAYSL
ncbi:hypothetical protein A3A20_01365 [Candidatus Wolfebacteria bacterium RIFCSPLOWO2_01_FULL_45_19]|uniref:Uncharacterized protein n=1 Tax=Candidatus Wolfebacteria bacterium RIFCSPLOWO2_01_FULL_45_19 TaxID=1802557 RepID=A0A1F8DT43_9BACT|nr:MAG: hypothetical protein A3A20_01365 [Candidatus Wolfebacteria bacterium RIFCSPLOWO2_01_FULL_45_19]